MQIKHLFFAFVVLTSLGCASVKMRQAIPTYTPEGCKAVDDGGIGESGNYFYANGYSTDPGTVFLQVASGNSRMIYACSDAAMRQHYSKLYDAYMTANFGGQNSEVDEKLKKTNAAIIELNGSMVTLAKIVAAKGGKVEEKKETSGTPSSAAPAPAPQLASIDAAFIVHLQTAKNKTELVNMLLTGAKQYPADVELLNRLAGKASLSKDENFATDKVNISKALEGGIR